jgi:transposase
LIATGRARQKRLYNQEAEMDKVAVGIDVAKDSLEVAMHVGDRLYRASFKNSGEGHAKLDRWIGKYRKTVEQVHVCLEATGRYGDEIAEYLYSQGHRISVVNPNRIKSYAGSKLRRNKTDKLDAELIADYCLKENPRAWQPRQPKHKALREIMRRIADLEHMLYQENNRSQAGNLPPEITTSLQEHLTYLRKCLQQFRTLAEQVVKSDPELQRQHDLIVSIPGIASKTAWWLLSELPTMDEFDHVNQVVAYCGLNPKVHRSGTSINHKPSLSKQGNSYLRKALYMPAMVACRFNPIMMTFAQRLSSSGKSSMCIIGAVMRKLLHLVYGILKSGKPFDPNHLSKLALPS